MSDWIEGTKPKYIEARYNAYISWDLDELGIDWDKVKDWGISSMTLTIDFKDGTSKDYEEWEVNEIDYKHGMEEMLILDENWNKVEGFN